MDSQLYNYKAQIISVYDGDTVTARLDLGIHISVNEKIRLFGINTPEIRGSEREEGLKSRDALRELILDKEVVIQTIKDQKGKYGRYLGVIHIEQNGTWVNVNEWLVEHGWAERKDY